MSTLKFALGVEPGNLELIHDVKRCEDLRSRDLPFLPTRGPAVVQAARGHDASTPKNEFE